MLYAEGFGTYEEQTAVINGASMEVLQHALERERRELAKGRILFGNRIESAVYRIEARIKKLERDARLEAEKEAKKRKGIDNA